MILEPNCLVTAKHPVSDNLMPVTRQALGQLGKGAAKVRNIFEDEVWVVQILPLDKYSTLYRGGKGCNLIFQTEDQISASLAIFKDPSENPLVDNGQLDVTFFTVCVNYDDYLRIVLPRNMRWLKRLTVITDTKNQAAVEELCHPYDVKIFVTDEFYHNDAPFNKGRAINAYMKTLPNYGWACHIDADIILPDDTIAIFQELDEITKQERENPPKEGVELKGWNLSALYGARRHMCPKNLDTLTSYLRNEVDPTQWKTGRNVVSFAVRRKSGDKYFPYLPIGYFQLFNLMNRFEYPETVDHAGDSDLLFAAQWNTHVHLKHLKTVHLPVLKGISCDNWKGRKTPRID